MKWYEEFSEHVKHLCWEHEEIPLEDVETALDIVYQCKESGGPKKAAEQLEAEHGIDPSIFGERFETL